MKTMAIRLEDETADLLALVAELESTSIIDQIRDAIRAHLERKVAEGDLAKRAEAVLDAIDREANAKKQAIGDLFGKAAQSAVAPKEVPRPKPAASRRSKAEPEESRANPIGFAPARRR